MKRFFYSIILLIGCLQCTLAQTKPNDSLARAINIKALLLLDKYEAAISFKSKEQYSEFENLFLSKNAVLFNDVMPDNRLKEVVSVSDYQALIKKYYSDTSFLSVRVKPYEIGVLSLEGKEYAYLSVLAQKMIKSITKNKIVYADTFNIQIDIVVNLFDDECKIHRIVSVDRREDYLMMYPQYRGFFNKQSLKNDTILVNGVLCPVDSSGFIQLKNTNKKSEFLVLPYHKQFMYKRYRVPDNIPLVKNKLNLELDKNMVYINFWKWMVFVDFQNHVIPQGSSPVKASNDTLGINPKNKGSFSNYFLLNLTRRVNNKGYWSVKFGAGADVFNYSLNLASNINTYPSIDPDGDPYLRINRIYNIKETHNMVYATFPIKIEKGFTFGKNSVYVQAAYYLMMRYSSFYNIKADATYAGYYDYLFDITISENGVYDFGTYNFDYKALPLESKAFMSSQSVSVGYLRQFSRRVYFDIGLNYRMSGDYFFVENNKSLSDSKNGINSLTNLNNRLQLNYLNVNFGLSIKI